MTKFVLVALLAGTAAAPAAAQVNAPFTGPRVEAVIGYDRTDVDQAGDSDGITYGVGAGYDFQMGGMVAGVEAELTDSNVDQCAVNVDLTGDELCAQVGRDIYVGGRVGGVVGANTLLYAKAGYVNGRVAAQYEDGIDGDTGDFEEGQNIDGVRVGAGLEHQFGTNTFVKAEYRYSNYEAGIEKHQGVVGVGFRF